MLKVDQYDYIRTAHRAYGKSIKQIARDTGHSKNTIKKILRGQYNGYTPREQQSYPALGPYLGIIDRWLEKDKVNKRRIKKHNKEPRTSSFAQDVTLNPGGSKLGDRGGSIFGCLF